MNSAFAAVTLCILARNRLADTASAPRRLSPQTEAEQVFNRPRTAPEQFLRLLEYAREASRTLDRRLARLLPA